jgi:hypothetical protein
VNDFKKRRVVKYNQYKEIDVGSVVEPEPELFASAEPEPAIKPYDSTKLDKDTEENREKN